MFLKYLRKRYVKTITFFNHETGRIDYRIHDEFRPVGVIAATKDGNEIKYATSFIHESDRWNKKVGRQLAIGRLLSPFPERKDGRIRSQEIEYQMSSFLENVKRRVDKRKV